MEKIVWDMPAMYADHHVLSVREILGQLEGIEELYASSAWKQVILSYNPEKITGDAIQIALTEAGYPPGKGAPPILVKRDDVGRDPHWATEGPRTSKTHPSDLKHIR